MRANCTVCAVKPTTDPVTMSGELWPGVSWKVCADMKQLSEVSESLHCFNNKTR